MEICCSTIRMQSFFKVLLSVFLLINSLVSAQENLSKYAIDASVFYGNTFEHNSKIAHLLSEHPTGFLLSWSKLSNPEKYWSYKNNYPELGISFSYHQSHVEALGNNYTLYGHLHWYFASRLVQFKLAQGIAYADNPYHPDKNFRNVAYGSSLLAATRLELNFVKEYLWDGLGVLAGLGVVHYSNGSIKKPNTSANTMYAHIGLRYNWEQIQVPKNTELQWTKNDDLSVFRYEAIVRGGVNQFGIGAPTRGFLVIGGTLGKRWSYRSGWHAGVEYFHSPFLKDYAHFRSVAYPEDGYKGTEDYKRIGIYAGYDLFISDAFSLFANLGYYPYWPIPYDTRVYNRLGAKYYIAKSPIFAMVDVKAHHFRAEAMEFGLGYKF